MMIVKIGGGATVNVKGILEDVAELNEPVVLIHGANADRDALAEKLGSPTKNITSVSGVESVFTDEAAMDIMMMSYSGLRNKRIVELAQQAGVNAVGLTGLDGGLVRGKRNGGIRVQEGEKQKVLRDFSGKPKEINIALINLLLENGYTPVVTVPILDENNVAINTQNDSIARRMIQALNADLYIDLFEAPGLLKDRNDESSLIERLSPVDLERVEGEVEGRMRRKVMGTRRAFENGAKKVIYADGRVEHPVKEALNGKGTIIE